MRKLYEAVKKHKDNVFYFLHIVIDDLNQRAFSHDDTKLSKKESRLFAKYGPLLNKSAYLSKEYKANLKAMRPALIHHYTYNRHHPEYYLEHGIKSMSLVDLIEMLCDWRAASMKHVGGNIYKSIEINQERFGYSDELKQIFINTAQRYL